MTLAKVAHASRWRDYGLIIVVAAGAIYVTCFANQDAPAMLPYVSGCYIGGRDHPTLRVSVDKAGILHAGAVTVPVAVEKDNVGTSLLPRREIIYLAGKEQIGFGARDARLLRFNEDLSAIYVSGSPDGPGITLSRSSCLAS